MFVSRKDRRKPLDQRIYEVSSSFDNESLRKVREGPDWAGPSYEVGL